MIETGAHLEYVVAAYLGVGVAIGLVIAYVAFEAVRVRQRLKRLEQLGVRRRSAEVGP